MVKEESFQPGGAHSKILAVNQGTALSYIAGWGDISNCKRS